MNIIFPNVGLSVTIYLIIIYPLYHWLRFTSLQRVTINVDAFFHQKRDGYQEKWIKHCCNCNQNPLFE